MTDGRIRSPGVGKVLEILVRVGASVALGEEVLVIESMKVEIPVAAPRAGRVVELSVAPGDQVQAGDVLLVIASE
jgi:biotin carboxyl carrier protein